MSIKDFSSGAFGLHIPPQYQHHVFYFMQELLETLAAGQDIAKLPPRIEESAA